jgi:hypothetical protein
MNPSARWRKQFKYTGWFLAVGFQPRKPHSYQSALLTTNGAKTND